MSIHPHKTKPGWWIIDCRPDGYRGKRKRIKIEGSKERAIKWQNDIMRRSTSELPIKVDNISIIYSKWILWYKDNKQPRTVDDAESCWKLHLKKMFEKLYPKHLSKQLIESYKKTRLDEGVKPRTINKEIAYLSSMIRWAVNQDLCDPLGFTITGYSKKMTTPDAPRPLTQEQVTAIYEAIEPQYRLIFLLMADAGMRRNEAMLLKGEQIDIDLRTIYTRGKGNKERFIPIATDRLLAEIQSRKDTGGYLSMNPITKKPWYNIRKALIRAAKKAGLEKHVHHHLLRHSFGTLMTVAGCDLSALQKMMGHSSPNTTMIYQHLAGKYLSSQAQKLNDMIIRKKSPYGHMDSKE